MSRLALLASILLVGCPVVLADEPAPPADGLYWPAEAGRPVPQATGAPLRIGARYEPTIRRADVVSRSNANDDYLLELRCAYDPSANDRSLVLVSKGKAYDAGGCGRSGTELQFWSFRLGGRATALAVASRFHAKVSDRRHPGYRLRVAFTQVGAWTAAGPLVVELTIQNVDTHPVVFDQGGMNRGRRDNQFTFIARGGPRNKSIPDTGDFNHFGGIAVRRILEPGETHRQQVDLRKWFALEAGTYELIGSYAMSFYDPGEPQASSPIWMDFATANFVATVRKDT